MVFVSIVLTVLIVITIWLVAYDSSPINMAASAVGEVVTGSCGLICRHQNTLKQRDIEQKLRNITQDAGQTTSRTFVEATLALEQAIQRNQTTRPSEQIDRRASGPLAVATESETKFQMDGCVCETCACDLIENVIRSTKPVESAYQDFREAIYSSYLYLLIQDIFTHIVNTYPAALQRLEDNDKIDSQENFYFLQSRDGPSNKTGTLSRFHDVKIRSSPNLFPPVGSSALSGASKSTSTKNKPSSSPKNEPSSSPKSEPSSSPKNDPSSRNTESAQTQPTKKSCMHHESEKHADLTIREAATKPELSEPRQPQTFESLDKDIKEFLRNGPPQYPPLNVCPSCKSQGKTCVRGCPNERQGKNKEEPE